MDQAKVARDAIDLYLELKVIPPVARLIYERHGKRFSVSGLRQWLLNPVLIGNTPYDKRNPKPAYLPQGNQIIYGTHVDQALMTTLEQKQIADILTENVRVWGKNRTAFQNPLSGLVFCDECGVSCDLMSKPSGGKRVDAKRLRSFYCRTRSKKPAGKFCSQRGTYKFEVIEAIAIRALTEKASAIATIFEADEKIENPKIKELQGQVTVMQSMGAVNPVIVDAIAKLEIEIENLKRSQLHENYIDHDLRDLLIEAFSDAGFFATLDNADRRSLYKALISKIVVRDRGVLAVELKL